AALNFLTAAPSNTGLVFNLIYDQDVQSLPPGMTAALNSVTQFLSAHFTDSLTINLHVGFGEVRGHTIDQGALASSVTDYVPYTYSQIAGALAGDAMSADDSTSSSALPGSDPIGGQFVVSVAEAAALRLPNAATTVDAYIGFNSTAPWDYDRSDG